MIFYFSIYLSICIIIYLSSIYLTKLSHLYLFYLFSIPLLWTSRPCYVFLFFFLMGMSWFVSRVEWCSDICYRRPIIMGLFTNSLKLHSRFQRFSRYLICRSYISMAQVELSCKEVSHTELSHKNLRVSNIKNWSQNLT